MARLEAKKGLEVLMEMYTRQQETINKAAFNKSQPANPAIGGSEAIKIEPIVINGAEILTLKALAQTFQKLYQESKEQTKKTQLSST